MTLKTIIIYPSLNSLTSKIRILIYSSQDERGWGVGGRVVIGKEKSRTLERGLVRMWIGTGSLDTNNALLYSPAFYSEWRCSKLWSRKPTCFSDS